MTSLIQLVSHDSLVTVNRPRLLICGDANTGFLTHVVPALLHDMEGVPIHCLDLPSIYGTNVRTPEESCAQVRATSASWLDCMINSLMFSSRFFEKLDVSHLVLSFFRM